MSYLPVQLFVCLYRYSRSHLCMTLLLTLLLDGGCAAGKYSNVVHCCSTSCCFEQLGGHVGDALLSERVLSETGLSKEENGTSRP